jgi:hypothetical protein
MFLFSIHLSQVSKHTVCSLATDLLTLTGLLRLTCSHWLVSCNWPAHIDWSLATDLLTLTGLLQLTYSHWLLSCNWPTHTDWSLATDLLTLTGLLQLTCSHWLVSFYSLRLLTLLASWPPSITPGCPNGKHRPVVGCYAAIAMQNLAYPGKHVYFVLTKNDSAPPEHVTILWKSCLQI